MLSLFIPALRRAFLLPSGEENAIQKQFRSLKRIDPGGSAVRGPILKSMLAEELNLLLG